MEDSKPPTGVLSGVRIIDLTSVVMGPLATQMLGDMGADVIRVENPGGDTIRHYEPMRSPKMSAFGMNLNRNKRSIELDLKSDDGRRIIRELVAGADVVVANMRRKALGRLGLDEDSLRSINPSIIYCVANGYGSDGPYADRAVYDDVIQAASGLAGMFAWVGDEPQLVPSILADKLTGVHIAFAIAAALYGRSQSGEGVSIEVPMAETMAAFNLAEHLGGHTFEPPLGEFSYARVATPNRRPRRTADGWMVILPYSDDNWERVWSFVGQPEHAGDPRFVTNSDRVNNADALYALFGQVVSGRTTTEWVEFCELHSIPAAEVLDLKNVRDDPHFAAVGLLQEDVHPTEGPYRYVRSPIRFNGLNAPLRHHAPRLGADASEILAELGWDKAEIDRFLG